MDPESPGLVHRSRSSEAREVRRGISDTGPIAKIRAPPSHLTAAVAHRRSEDQVCWLQDHHSRRCDGHHGNRATFQRTSCTGCESSRNWNARYEDLLRRLSIIRSADDPTELQLGEAARHLALDSAHALVIRLVAEAAGTDQLSAARNYEAASIELLRFMPWNARCVKRLPEAIISAGVVGLCASTSGRSPSLPLGRSSVS